jgi:hypothetical protein
MQKVYGSCTKKHIHFLPGIFVGFLILKECQAQVNPGLVGSGTFCSGRIRIRKNRSGYETLSDLFDTDGNSVADPGCLSRIQDPGC